MSTYLHAGGLAAIPDSTEEQAKRQKRMARFQKATDSDQSLVRALLFRQTVRPMTS